MKKFLILSVFAVLMGCGVDEVSNEDNLPWKVSNKDDGSTHVLGMDIGNSTFKDIMYKLKLLAEPALFEAPDGKLTLEAFFGKQKFGALEARLVVEMDANEAVLKKMLKEQVDRDSTPSNHWKYGLNVENTRLANDMRVWRLVYLPVADYQQKQMNFFGRPEEKIKVNETAEYWLYPSKGMALLYDTAGKEIFYYAGLKDFARLKASLPMKVQVQMRQ